MSKNPFYRRRVDQSIIDRLNPSWQQSFPRSYSPWAPLREKGILALNPPSQGDIREDSRYQHLKQNAFQASPYQKQLLDLQVRRLAQIMPDRSNNITFDYNNADTSHGFDPKTGKMLINGKDRINNPANSFNHESYHVLSFLDNKNYYKILEDMRNQNHDATTWNTIKSTIDPKNNFMMGYGIPNTSIPNRKHLRTTPLIGDKPTDSSTLNPTNSKQFPNYLLADEFGGFSLENADNPLAFKPTLDVTKPFLTQNMQNLQKIYSGYDADNEFPVVHQTLSDVLEKINQNHTGPTTTVSVGQRDVGKGAKYSRMLKQYDKNQLNSQGNQSMGFTQQQPLTGGMTGQQFSQPGNQFGQFGGQAQNVSRQNSNTQYDNQGWQQPAQGLFDQQPRLNASTQQQNSQRQTMGGNVRQPYHQPSYNQYPSYQQMSQQPSYSQQHSSFGSAGQNQFQQNQPNQNFGGFNQQSQEQRQKQEEDRFGNIISSGQPTQYQQFSPQQQNPSQQQQFARGGHVTKNSRSNFDMKRAREVLEMLMAAAN